MECETCNPDIGHCIEADKEVATPIEEHEKSDSTLMGEFVVQRIPWNLSLRAFEGNGGMLTWPLLLQPT
jgi:hypothetical protein